MDSNTTAFGLPAIGRKKLVAAFDRGRLTSDGGVLLARRSDNSASVIGWRR